MSLLSPGAALTISSSWGSSCPDRGACWSPVSPGVRALSSSSWRNEQAAQRVQLGLQGLLRVESRNHLCNNYSGMRYFIQNSTVCSSAESYIPKILFFLSLNLSLSLVAKSCPTLCNPMDCSLPGKNTGVGCHFLLQGIFPTQGSNAGLLHCRQILYRLDYEGSPIGASILKELQKPLKHGPLPSGSNSVQKACSQGVCRDWSMYNTLRDSKLDTAQVSLSHLSRREIKESQRQLALLPRVGWGWV